MENVNKRKILVFGGSFNPPTRAHQKIILACLELPGFEQVWVIPSGDRLDKQMQASDQDRLEMLKLVKEHEFNDDKRLNITDFELKLDRPTQTYRTIGALSAAYSDIEFWFTFGSDAYWEMPNWENGLEMQKNLNLVIIYRQGSTLPDRDDIIVPLLISEYDNVSSTQARAAIAVSSSLERFVCRSVSDYISKTGIYSAQAKAELSPHS